MDRRYFVVLMCTLVDDVPLYVADQEDNARNFAAMIDDVPLPEEVSDLFNMDFTSDRVCVKLITFSEGKPVAVEVVKTFE